MKRTSVKIKTSLSAIRTSGKMHLGHYLGCIKNWLKMQEEYRCYFFVADLHSITTNFDSGSALGMALDTLAIYLAAGLDPKKSTIFMQSMVPEHTELAWLLGCITPLGWLNRMTQFKDKSESGQNTANLGLLSYPVLMAADVLLYDADVVPVGADQKQHMEFIRDVANAFNRRFSEEVFTIPEPLIMTSGARIMSLVDGTKKMSKTDRADASRINLSDTPDVIQNKLKKAKTDTFPGIVYDPQNRPEVSNLLMIYSSLTRRDPIEVAEEYRDLGFAVFKDDLIVAVIAELDDIRCKYFKLTQDKSYLLSVLKEGSEKAREKARDTLDRVRSAFGFLGYSSSTKS